MKMKVLRFLVLPWVLFFIAIVSVMVFAGAATTKLPELASKYGLYLLFVGIVFCLYSNFSTLTRAGIWLAHSLPSSLRRSPWGWFFRAVLAAAIALGFYLVGQLPWIPLLWQAMVIPVAFAASLFVIVWSLMGLVLTWSSQIAFSRFSAFALGLPVFAMVPLTAIFLGKTITTAYVASRPETSPSLMQAAAQKDQKKEMAQAANTTTTPTDTKPTVTPLSDEAKLFYSLAIAGKSCAENSKEIQKALTPYESEDVAFWAIKAIKCTEMKSVVALPKLAKIMVEHSSSKVRAAAILAMPKFGTENVRRIGYLLVKRISEKEPVEVIEAAAQVLIRLGEDEKKWAHNRLKSLLDSSKASGTVAKVLVENLKSDELVIEYISTNLPGQGPARARAVKMVCALPPSQRQVAEPYIESIVASIQTGAEDDPAIVALGCMGQAGFEAIRREVTSPKKLGRPVAARALAEIDIKDNTEGALEIAKDCAKDADDTVRKWCSQALGEIGSAALPQILDLLKSNKSELKDAGQNALNYFNDPKAKIELFRVRAENSGWMATQKKLEIAKAVDGALVKIVTEESQSQRNEGKTE